MRRWLKPIGLALTPAPFLWGLFLIADDWRWRTTLDQAKRDFASARHRPARDRLAWLAARRPGQGEVEWMLGSCEEAEGNVDAALAAWARVPPDSAHGEQALLKRAEGAIQKGRIAEAETLLETALRHPGRSAVELRHQLMLLYRYQGRLDEVAALIQANWGQERDLAGTLHDHAGIDLERFPFDGTFERYLDEKGSLAPKDDRIWLARANLAIQTGRCAEARKWLDACRAPRPRDPAVWHAWLNWAMAAKRPVEARQAFPYLPAKLLPPPRILALRAWFAADRGDTRQETSALERLDELFRNRGNGTFEDVTVASGIAGLSRGHGHGVTVGDYDNDGDPDLFITRWRAYALYRKRGDGRFEDVTAAAGLGGDRDWPSS
jgi:tetratricopeptide (TPR) repeat protein